jgi:DNA polymerase
MYYIKIDFIKSVIAMSELLMLSETIKTCTKCELSKQRTNAVPGEGAINAKIMFIGEAPGKTEDREGRPFVGRAGKTLNELLDEVSIFRERVYITNIVKCRPPKNRVPKSSEVEACRSYLERQIELIRPELIVALGQSALKTLTGIKDNLAEVHGKTVDYSGHPLLITYHPAAMIYNRKLRTEILEDLTRIKEITGC